ncbi:type II and III secretion system protein family protein (plasmid) [Rhizobium leguminosarum]|uniref:type II and III secretion system protein family protein n=1 Tax=Rhizobium TaxID=379 RepID=UPI001030E555|nr:MULTISPECIES: type II and III secretion system protein family protein [Rhizobium]MBY5378387.1 type II and III secretion system protein family protein [Rhizobium leguminosarum]TBF35133.1 type II and III secretion system protein family protein [Rhizobium leguminosarum]TBF87967.1 type II and III secretion system protein family protein [Rhizobium leguminosarum]WSH48674.1 type II and III secretion system protein family protein [Rhizobium johnstonii]
MTRSSILAKLWTLLPFLLALGALAPIAGAQSFSVDAGSGQAMMLPLGQGRMLRFDQPVESVFIADAKIADVRVVSPGVVYVFALKTGRTNLIALSPDQKMRGSIDFWVVADPRPVEDAQRAVQPNSTIDVSLFGTQPSARGHARTMQEAMDTSSTIEAYAPESQPAINNTTVAGSNQVNIRVRFAEISRSQLLRYGVTWEVFINSGAFSFGLVSGGNLSADVARGASNAISGGGAWNGNRVDALLEALQANGILTVLAEPNITAVTGETASFLAGGEIPIPIPVTNEQIGIEYKQYGVSLLFTPTLLPNGRISMRVRPEVSSLSANGSVSIANLHIPALQVRRADTTVEIGSGQTFAIGGLFQRNSSQDIEKIPVLGDVPILGDLFKSKRFQRNETELAILITPYLVEPVTARNLKTPLDGPAGALSVPTAAKPTKINRGYGFYVD